MSYTQGITAIENLCLTNFNNPCPEVTREMAILFAWLMAILIVYLAARLLKFNEVH